ncbi:MAG TPA: imidazole glycerol phosphate synthase subunit HisH [Rikenellaceae bacterium]|nr:imidazole glycerol phosphate synthase subunit HisH [Rikenellaceae bacterium]
MTIIIDYNTGNLFSLTAALNRLGSDYTISSAPEEILSADAVILPGVGEASNAFSSLKKKGLEKVIPQIKAPVLGICIGMQLMCAYSEEGDTKCLGIFPNIVKKLCGQGIKVPHMGWNTVKMSDSPLFEGITNDAYFYFVHSFAPDCGQYTVARTVHGLQFSSALSKNNFYGTQFHPEKSGIVGMKFLENFLKIKI